MQFYTRKRRQPPAIIIVSLIDILIVLLIFMMVTTTFKNRPAFKLNLPESKQASSSAGQNGLVLSIRNQAPYYYFKAIPVTLEKLKESLEDEARLNSEVRVAIDADKEATLENFLKVIDAVRDAKIKNYTISANVPGLR